MNGDFALRDWRRFLGRYGATCVHARTVPHQEQLVLCAKSDDGLVHLALSYTAQTGNTVWANLFVPAHYLPQVKDWYNWGELKPAQLIPVLDRLIAIYGPQFTGFDPDIEDQKTEAESRPKGTDLVASATRQQDGALHGGDGASGETGNPSPVPAPGEGAEQGMDSVKRSGTATYPQAGTDASSGPPDAEGRSTEEGEGRVSPTGPDATNAEVSRTPPEGERGELTAEGGTPTRSAETAEADTPQREAAVEARASESTSDEDTGETSGEGCLVNSLPTLAPRFSSRELPGGNFLEEDRARYLARGLTREARKVKRALERLIWTIRSIDGVEETPRLDAQRLIREKVTQRWNFSRIRRREGERGVFYLLADVSGSCSACCTETMAACLAIAETMADVAVIAHSNGHVLCPGHFTTAPTFRGWPQRGYTLNSWIAEVKRPIAGVVAFGDWDAGGHYRTLCESAPFIWLDSYAAKHGVRPAGAKLRWAALGWKRQPLAWYQGVNSARTAAIALRDAERKIRKGG